MDILNPVFIRNGKRYLGHLAHAGSASGKLLCGYIGNAFRSSPSAWKPGSGEVTCVACLSLMERKTPDPGALEKYFRARITKIVCQGNLSVPKTTREIFVASSADKNLKAFYKSLWGLEYEEIIERLRGPKNHPSETVWVPKQLEPTEVKK